jgi:hypothetical protein
VSIAHPAEKSEEKEMSPVRLAKRLLGDSWLDDLEGHLLHGYVISTPSAFLMGRPVPYGADVIDAWEQWDLEECNAWFVWMGVGDPQALLDLMPVPLPWIGWCRIGRDWPEIHWIRTEELRRKLSLHYLRQTRKKPPTDGPFQNSRTIVAIEKG